MHAKFVTSALALVTAATALIAAVQQHGGHAAKDDAVAQAGEMFTSRCVTCHQAPDLTFATDRAWLTQVLDTA